MNRRNASFLPFLALVGCASTTKPDPKPMPPDEGKPTSEAPKEDTGPLAPKVDVNGAMYRKVTRIIKEQLDVPEKDVTPNATFIDDLGADSLGLAELVCAFEEDFGIDIPDEDTEHIRTVEDAVLYLEARKGSAPTATP